MRKLLTAVVAGALAVSLGTPAFGDSKAAKRSADQITATREGDSDGGHDAGREGRRSRRSYGSSYDYRSSSADERPAGRRRANARQRECNDAYSFDRVFYDRYCRDGSTGRFGFRSSDGYPDQVSAPADQPDPTADPVAPVPDQTASPAPDQTASPTPGHNAPPAADSPTAQPQSPPGASPSPRPPGSEQFRNPDPASRPTWGGYGSGAPGPAGPAGPVGGSY